MKRLALAVALLAAGPAVAADGCATNVVRREALRMVGRQIPASLPPANVTETRTLSRKGDTITCEVTIWWADREDERVIVTAKRR